MRTHCCILYKNCKLLMICTVVTWEQAMHVLGLGMVLNYRQCLFVSFVHLLVHLVKVLSCLFQNHSHFLIMVYNNKDGHICGFLRDLWIINFGFWFLITSSGLWFEGPKICESRIACPTYFIVQSHFLLPYLLEHYLVNSLFHSNVFYIYYFLQ